MKTKTRVLALLAAAMLLTSCGGRTSGNAVTGPENRPGEPGEFEPGKRPPDVPGEFDPGKQPPDVPGGQSGNEQSAETAPAADLDGMDTKFTDRDRDGTYAENSTRIVFSGSEVSIAGSGVTASGSAVTVTKKGTYILSGSTDDGSVTVSVSDGDKVQLVLDGLDLTSKNRPAVFVSEADKVFVTLAAGSVNRISDGASYTASDGDTNLDGAIFSRCDITFNGAGELTVNGNNKHGIVTKDDLVITEGNIAVSSKNVALSGKDSVKIAGGRITLDAGSDGIRADNEEKDTKGFVYIADGNIVIKSGNDGIQAYTALMIDGGNISVISGGGSQNASVKDGKENSGWGMWGREGSRDAGETVTESAKGLKSGSHLIISGGKLTLDTSDDAIHTNGIAEISGGEIDISSGDDGIHADSSLTVSGGNVRIGKSYEGLESSEINISGGMISVVASDDGINAAGGNDGSAFGRPGQGMFSSSSGKLTISGGYILINASGDGVDSNGSITVSGGVTLVSGPTDNGNGALDYETAASVTGGVFVACGSTGMAMNFSSAENQGAILVQTGTQKAGTSVAICDPDGCAIVSFTPEKQYQCVTVSAPGIKAGGTYTVVTGAKVTGADENGFTENASLTGGATVSTVKMTSSLYGSGSGMQGGMPGRR